MNELNFTFKWQALRSSLMMTLCLFMISMVSVQNVNAQNQGDLIIATNAEIVIPSCIDEITYFYFFTTVDDDPNSPTVGTPTITGLDDYAFTGPTQIDLHDAGGFNYATWEIAITIDGGNNTDFFTITYESETVTPAIDVIKDTDIDVAVLAPDQNVTIPVCEDNMDILASFTVLDCAGAPALETDFQLQGFGQFAGQALSTSLSDVASGPNQRTYFITNPGGAFASLNVVESASPSSDRITITYKGTSAELRVNAVAQFEEPDAVIGDNMDITAVDCSDNVTFFYAFNIIGFCGEFDGRLTVFDDGGTGIGTFPPFVNITGNTAYVEYQGQVPNFKDGVARNYFPDFEFDGNLLDSDLFPTITVRSSLNEAPTLQLPDNLTFRIPVCEDEIEEKVSVQICDDCDVNGGVLRWTFGNQDALELDLASIQAAGNCLYAELDITLTEADNGTTLSLEATDPEGAFTILTANIEVIKEDVPDFSQLACNPNTNITLSPDCEATIIPSMLINANSLCPDAEAAIFMTATLKEAHHVKNPTQEDVSGFGEISVSTPGKYKYTLSVGDDECWGYFTIEDKDGPFCDPAGDPDTDLVVCGQDVTVDPSGVDDLATEIVSIMVVEKYGKDAIEPWFDQLEEDDFDDCSDLANIEYTTTKETFCGDYDGDIQAPKGWEVCFVFKRTWTAYDWKGHASEGCSQYVAVVRPTKLEFTEKIEVECGHEDVAPVGPYFVDLPAGYTCPDCAGEKVIIGDGQTIAKWSAALTPGVELGLCSNEGENCSDAYKQINEWTWLDVCGHDPITREQTLISSDTKGPKITPNDVSVWTNPFDCTTSMTASFEKEDYCSEVVGSEVTAFYQVLDHHGNVIKTVRERMDGMSITINDVPLETEVEFEFSAWDCCGNMSMKTITANSWDNRAPVCIANDELEVGLIITDHDNNGNGVIDPEEHAVGARIYPEDVDDTSKDNCFPLKMEIRKVYADGSVGDWGPYVEYSYKDDADFNGDKCTDEQWVDLRVTEYNTKTGELGLSTVCQSKLILRDNNPPRFTSTPDCKVVDCFEHDLTFDPPTIWGFCVTGEPKDTPGEYHCPEDLSDECEGATHVVRTLTRTWTYTKMTEHDMFTISASQTIYVNEVRDEKFTFPYDDKLVCTTDVPAASSLDDILVNNGCSEWVMNVSQDTFAGDEGACYKILRTYDFINWCLWDGISEGEYVDKDGADLNNDDKLLEGEDDQVMLVTGDDDVEEGRFKYLQIIKVVDETDPTGSVTGVAGCDFEIDGCDQGTVEFTVTFGDACSSAEITDWYINVPGDRGGFDAKANADGTVTVYKRGVAKGTYELHVRLDDQCGNFIWVSGSVEVTQSDCKKPSPVGLVTFTPVMENGSAAIWVTDVLISYSDNCPGPYMFGLEKLTGGSDPVGFTDAQGVTFDCDDVGNSEVALWMKDAHGNTQYVRIPVILTNEDGFCAGADPGMGDVSGKITNESDEDVDQVTVNFTGTINPYAELFNGLFSYSVPMNSDVTVQPEKDLGHLNGVGTADLVALQRHILGIVPLNTAYQLIAADVTNDAKVNTKDMLHISRLVLGIYDEFPEVNSWRFVAKSHTFANPTAPWGFPEAIDFTGLASDEQADFIGIKMGDLTGNAKPSNLLGDDNMTNGDLAIAIDDVEIKAGSTHEIEFTAKDFNDFAGYQFSIELGNVTFEGIELGLLPNHSDANFGLNRLDEGIITTNWANASGIDLEDGTVLFTLKVSANRDIEVSDAISISSAVTTAEAYNNSLERYGVKAFFNRTNAEFSLLQNTPNPFNGETIIGFTLPEAGPATLKVMDVSGKLLKQVTGTYAKGFHQITLDKSDLGATGVLYYQLDTNTDSATKKMVILD